MIVSILLLSLSAGGFAIHVPRDIKPEARDTPTPALSIQNAIITQAPSAKALELRLKDRRALKPRATSVQSCADYCIQSVVTKSTECSRGDYECECESDNAQIIEAGAFSCVEAACGPYVAEAVWSEAESFCFSVLYDGGATTEPAATDAASSTKVPDDTGATSQTSTSSISISTGSSSSSGSSGTSPGTSSGSSSGSTAESKSGSSLSTGAIVGIAIGAAGGGIILCAILFMVYKFCLHRKPVYKTVPPAEVRDTSNNSASGGLVDSGNSLHPELDGKPGLVATTRSVSPAAQNTSTVSRHPSVISNPSPQTQYPGAALPPQQTPIYPGGMTELQAGNWLQQPQHSYTATQAVPPVFATHGNEPQPGQQVHYEMHEQPAPPELQENTNMARELHGQSYGSGVYEMSSTRLNA